MTSGQPAYPDRSAITREFSLFPHLRGCPEQRAARSYFYERASRATIWRGIIFMLLLFWSLFAYGVFEFV
jgi:hypothetical protein